MYIYIYIYIIYMYICIYVYIYTYIHNLYIIEENYAVDGIHEKAFRSDLSTQIEKPPL